jgi:tetratricopeptide (TPR) repeat protein
MKRGSPIRMRAVRLALCALVWTCVCGVGGAQSAPQASSVDTTQLLGKAHALEVRGRIDMAKQIWQQVLLVDSKNSDALAGMARASKLEGKTQEANEYLNKLRAVNPNDPNIARVQQMGTSQDMSTQLQEAGRLAQAGQYARAMTILRQVYGTNPPPGDPALSYYQTEAATEDGRPHAIAGLRELMDKYPADSRYQIALGKILTYNPRTREEGRKLLQKHPADPEAAEALRQSLVWDAQNPTTAGDIRAYLAKHKDQQLSTALAQTEAAAKRNGGRIAGPSAAPPTPEQLAEQAALRERNAESQAAYNALNAKNYPEAESRFQAMLAKDPQNAQALAGLGYVRMGQSNFGGAISYLEQAEQDGSHDPGVDKALRDSRFFYTMQVATAALNENDLTTAQTQFGNAAHLRPNDPSPLLGLGGTLMKAQQPGPAVGVFTEYVRMAPNDKAAWRGLFMAQYGAGEYEAALDTDRRIPAGIKKLLIHDPEYLRTLASVYQALGRDADAQRVLRSALDMPFPVDARGVRADMQLQYASLLSAAGHKDQAAGLYKQVLEGDSTNIAAYEGLINTDHELKLDADAYQVLQSMPPATYEQAMQAQGFQTTVAAIYQSQGHYDLAQQTLETYIENQQASNQPAPVAAEIQLAGIYLQHGDTEHAFPIFRAIVVADPGRVDAWNGLITSLHATGHDQEALAEIQQIPPNTRLKLETDPAYLQTVGSIYAGLKQPQAAMAFYSRVQQRYVAQHMVPPADIDIQEAWLLFNSHNDPILLRQLLALGGRPDLTDQQRLTVQTIWANWAVRRANQNIAEGNYKRALAILNASAKAFPGNPDVLKALASGYAAVGLPKQAVDMFKAQDLSSGSIEDYRAAVGAALSANDLKDAELWLRFGLDQYPRDGALLVLAAKFETARGDSGRAAEYYKASLQVFPKDDPGLMLTDEMLHPLVRRVQHVEQSQDLATLLSQADPNVNRGHGGNNGIDLQPEERPYLPSYTGTAVTAPVQIYNNAPAGSYSNTRAYPTNTAPAESGYGVYDPSAAAQQQQRGTTLKDYNPDAAQQLQEQQRNSVMRNTVPQSKVEAPKSGDAVELASAKGVIFLHPSAAMEAKYGPYVSYDPAEGLPQRTQVAADEGVTARMSTASFHQQSTQYQAPYTPPVYGAPANTQQSQTAGAGNSQSSQQAQPIHLRYPQPSPAGQGSQQSAPVTPQGSNGSAGYVAPVQSYTPPAQNYVTPAQSYTAPVESYVPPAHGYTPPAQTHVPASHPKAVSKPVTPYASHTRVSAPVQEPSSAAHSFATPTPGFSAEDGIRQGPITSSQPTAYPQPGAAQASGSQQGVTQDGTPIVSYIQTSKPAVHHAATKQSSASVRERAEAIRRNQAEAPEQMTGQSHPPVETLDSAPDAAIQNTQFNPAAMQGSQIPQPGAPQDRPAQQQTTTYRNATPSQTGDSYGQQYPQPNTRGTTTTAPSTRRRSTTTRSTPQTPAPAAPQSPVTYPGYTQPLANPGYPQIPTPYPLAPAPSDYDLQQKNVPPLRGYYDPRVDETTPLTDRQQAELDLATIEGSYSAWVGASVIGAYRSGTPGVDRMASVEVPFEASAALGKSWRITAIPTAIFLNSGVLNTQTSLGSFPVFGTVHGDSNLIYPQQYSVGIGGEVQLTSQTFAIAGGYSAYGFLVRNGFGRVRWRPGNSHFTLFGGRDPVKETQLSYSGLRDPGQPNPFTLGPIWGGVVSTGGGVRIDAGNEKAGLYVQGEGASLTGYHVLQNHKYDGTFGAYFRVKVWPEYGALNIGGTIFGEHYDYNERIESYGWGGYFSPNVYFLFAVPVTFNGHYKENIHYTINGSVGVQTFQENSEPYYPLDPGLQLDLQSTSGGATTGACTGQAVGAAQPCGFIPYNSNTGLNYSIDAKMAYRVTDHWYIGGFLSGNNTNDYNTVSGGFFARYMIRPQAQTVDYPTGLFPVQGFRPLRVP